MKNLKIIEASKGDLPENILELVDLNEFFILLNTFMGSKNYTLLVINEQGNICRLFHSESAFLANDYFKNLTLDQINQILNYL